MMKIVLVSVALLAVALASHESHDSSEEHHRGTPPTLTAEQKAAFEAELKTKVATLSTDAQAAFAKLQAVFQSAQNNTDKSAIKSQIDAIVSGLSDSVKAELESVKPKGGPFGGHGGHGPRPTTVAA